MIFNHYRKGSRRGDKHDTYSMIMKEVLISNNNNNNKKLITQQLRVISQHKNMTSRGNTTAWIIKNTDTKDRLFWGLRIDRREICGTRPDQLRSISRAPRQQGETYNTREGREERGDMRGRKRHSIRNTIFETEGKKKDWRNKKKRRKKRERLRNKFWNCGMNIQCGCEC